MQNREYIGGASQEARESKEMGARTGQICTSEAERSRQKVHSAKLLEVKGCHSFSQISWPAQSTLVVRVSHAGRRNCPRQELESAAVAASS